MQELLELQKLLLLDRGVISWLVECLVSVGHRDQTVRILNHILRGEMVTKYLSLVETKQLISSVLVCLPNDISFMSCTLLHPTGCGVCSEDGVAPATQYGPPAPYAGC